MQVQIITIEVKSDVDPSTLLDRAIEFGAQVVSEFGGSFDEDTVCVADGEQ